MHTARLGVLGVGLAAVVCVAGCDTSSSSATGGTSRPQLTESYAWDGLQFRYPAGWSLRDFNLVSHGPGAFGPFLSDVRLVDPCATSQVAGGTEFSCPNPVVESPLGGGEGYAQWTSSFRETGGEPIGDLSHGFGSPALRARPAGAGCRAAGGTLAVTATIIASRRTSYTLTGCLNGGASSEWALEFRAVAASASMGGR